MSSVSRPNHPFRNSDPTLGIDVGGVIVARLAADTDTSFFGTRPMDTPPVEGAFEAIAELARRFEYRVHIVSKAGPKIDGLTRQWFGERRFFERTCVPSSNLYFVRKRHEKAPVCARLGITHFIDDRPDVLENLADVEHCLLFTGGLGPNIEVPPTDGRWTVADSWAGVLNRFAVQPSGS